MSAHKALADGFIDEIGDHYSTMREVFHESKFIHIINEEEKWKVKEFLILLFLFKVFLKYLILTIIYFKAVNKRKNNKSGKEMKGYFQFMIDEEQ